MHTGIVLLARDVYTGTQAHRHTGASFHRETYTVCACVHWKIRELENEIRASSKEREQKLKKQGDLRKKIEEFDGKLRLMRTESETKKRELDRLVNERRYYCSYLYVYFAHRNPFAQLFTLHSSQSMCAFARTPYTHT